MAKTFRLVNGVPQMIAVYSQVYTVSVTITSGTPVTLPSSGTYTSDDLKIYLDGKRLYATFDYNYEGTAPRTQVSFTFDVKSGSEILFEKELV